tara:strand:- start:329 stop:463 length:135 start_codon:yes stop_codon:yes gene_type:complete
LGGTVNSLGKLSSGGSILPDLEWFRVEVKASRVELAHHLVNETI